MGHDRIVIGASAGGIALLKQILAGLPEKLGAALFIVVHTTPYMPSKLAELLDAAGPLPAFFPEDGDPILPDRIYVAPPDNHMLVRRDQISVVRGPKENFTRPAIDPTFRSAAISYGPRVVGVVLSGALDDGTAGLVGIKARGGIVIVQDPNEAEQPSMPFSALEHVAVDHCVGGAEIGPLLVSVARQPAAPENQHPIPDWLDAESQIAEAATMQSLQRLDDVGVPSRLSCPECGGVMYEMNVDDLVRFRCRVGHAYSSKSLLADQTASLEASLWAGVRALEGERVADGAFIGARDQTQWEEVGYRRPAARHRSAQTASRRSASLHKDRTERIICFGYAGHVKTSERHPEIALVPPLLAGALRCPMLRGG